MNWWIEEAEEIEEGKEIRYEKVEGNAMRRGKKNSWIKEAIEKGEGRRECQEGNKEWEI